MPHEPKKRHSRQRQGKRRAHIGLTVKKATKCPNCGAKVMPHTICAACGYYKGKLLLKKKARRQTTA